MNGNITVDIVQLRIAARKVRRFADLYRQDYRSMYDEINSLRNVWEGTDNAMYIARLNKYQDDYDRMYATMIRYAEYIEDAARQYEEVENARAEAANKLNF